MLQFGASRGMCLVCQVLGALYELGSFAGVWSAAPYICGPGILGLSAGLRSADAKAAHVPIHRRGHARGFNSVFARYVRHFQVAV